MGVLVVVEHHEDQLWSRDPLPLVIAALLKLVDALFVGRPAVGVAEDITPEIDALRDEGTVVTEVALGAVAAQGHELFAVHAEERLHQVEVPGCTHAGVGETRILPPVSGPPTSIVGPARLPLVGDGEDGTVEFNGVSAPSGTGVDEALQGVASAHRSPWAVAPDEVTTAPKVRCRSGSGRSKPSRPWFAAVTVGPAALAL